MKQSSRHSAGTKPASVLPLMLLLLLAGASRAEKGVIFASPLQSLTIPDPEVTLDNGAPPKVEEDGELPTSLGELETPRSKFLPRFVAGLRVEHRIRERLAQGTFRDPSLEEDDEVDASGEDWIGKVAAAQERRAAKEDAIVEKVYDAAMARYDAKHPEEPTPKNPNKYQFVGIVDRSNPDKKVSWHARPKPASAKWSVRLVHVNKDAIVKDLFDQGKIDIFAKYTNTGETVVEGEGEEARETNIPIVTAKYEARERSWKNMFNFSPKHFFTDSSGNYWRERRLRPGMYTDGESVFESSYRYRDGRNGMHKVGSLQQFLSSRAVDAKDKEKILTKLREAAPDVVLEL